MTARRRPLERYISEELPCLFFCICSFYCVLNPARATKARSNNDVELALRSCDHFRRTMHCLRIRNARIRGRALHCVRPGNVRGYHQRRLLQLHGGHLRQRVREHALSCLRGRTLRKPERGQRVSRLSSRSFSVLLREQRMHALRGGLVPARGRKHRLSPVQRRIYAGHRGHARLRSVLPWAICVVCWIHGLQGVRGGLASAERPRDGVPGVQCWERAAPRGPCHMPRMQTGVIPAGSRPNGMSGLREGRVPAGGGPDLVRALSRRHGSLRAGTGSTGSMPCLPARAVQGGGRLGRMHRLFRRQTRAQCRVFSVLSVCAWIIPATPRQKHVPGLLCGHVWRGWSGVRAVLARDFQRAAGRQFVRGVPGLLRGHVFDRVGRGRSPRLPAMPGRNASAGGSDAMHTLPGACLLP